MNRLHHLDMIKGVAIFLVVMGHVLTFCIREIDRAAIFKFIEQVHMPLFFFVSGWLTVKMTDDKRLTSPNLIQKATRLILPMLATSSLWVLYFPHSGIETPLDSTFEGLWSNSWKNGYWFTPVLFAIMLIYTGLTPLLNRCKSIFLHIATASVAALALIIANVFIPTNISGILSADLIATFFPIFMFGTIARRYNDQFMKIVNSSAWQTVAIITFGITLYVCSWPWEMNLSVTEIIFIKVILHISLSIVIFAVFKRWADTAFAPDVAPAQNRFARLWRYLGTQSLAIYLLHFFFLFPMGNLFRPMLVAFNVSFTPLAAFAAFWATIIIALVLGVVKLIEPSRILSLLLTGKK